MKYIYNNKNIDIPDELYDIYNKNVAPISDKTIRYFIASSGVNKEKVNAYNDDELSKLVVDSIKDEIKAYKDMYDVPRNPSISIDDEWRNEEFWDK